MNHDYRVFEIEHQKSGHYGAQEIGFAMNWESGLIACFIEGRWYLLQPTGRYDLSNALQLMQQFEEDSQITLHKPNVFAAINAAQYIEGDRP